MNQNTSKIDYEINLLELFRVMWKEKIKIILIVLFSLGIGVYYVNKDVQPISYDISLNFQKANNYEFVKFAAIKNLLFEHPDVSTDIYSSNFENVTGLDSKFTLNSETIIEMFVTEFMDYDEVIKVLKDIPSIKKELSQLSLSDQQIKMYKYAKKFSIKKDFEPENKYSVNFRWHNKNEITQILNDVIIATLINLENSVYNELEDTLAAKKNTKIINDLKRIEYLVEQSAIAKEMNIQDNQISSIDMPDSNVMFNISTINANMPYYLRGYSAINKEINLIKNRKHQYFKNIYSEIDKLKQQNTNWIRYNIYLAEIKKVENQKDSVKIYSFCIIFGLMIGVLYVIILNALQSARVVKKKY